MVRGASRLLSSTSGTDAGYSAGALLKQRRINRRRAWRNTAAASVAGLLLALSGCGGGSEDDPQEVLADALGGGGESITSGILEVTAGIEAEGDQPGTVSLEISGPFDATDPDQLPSVNLEVNAEVASESGSFGFDGGLTITPSGIFVGFSGAEYQLDAETFSRLQAAYSAAAANRPEEEEGSLARFGLDPASWITGLKSEGTTEIDGEDYVHISGEVDVGALFADLSKAAARTGDARDREAARALGDLQETIKAASIDVYASKDDHQLRRVDLALEVDDPRGGVVGVDLQLGIGDPGSSQVITAPADARPLSELLAQLPGGVEALGGLGLQSGGLGGGGLGGGSPPVAGDKDADRYYDCVAAAKSDGEVASCADLLRD